MYLLPLVLPLLNLVLSCLFGKLLGKRVVSLFIFNMFLCVISCFFIFFEVGVSKFTCFIDLGS